MEKQIQILSSDNRKLKSTVQQLTEKIEMLSASDLQLKKAKELEKQSKERERLNEKESKKKIAEAEALADKYILNAKFESQKAKELQDEANKKQEKLDKEIRTAENKNKNLDKNIISRSKKLNDEFRFKWYFVIILITFYGIVITFLSACNSVGFWNDLISVIDTISKYGKGYYNVSSTLVSALWDGRFSQLSFNNVLFIILGGIVALICFLLPLAVMVISGIWLLDNFIEYCKDELSPVVFLACLIIAVWGANIIPFNAIVFLIVSQIAYIIIRWYIAGYKESRGL